MALTNFAMFFFSFTFMIISGFKLDTGRAVLTSFLSAPYLRTL